MSLWIFCSVTHVTLLDCYYRLRIQDGNRHKTIFFIIVPNWEVNESVFFWNNWTINEKGNLVGVLGDCCCRNVLVYKYFIDIPKSHIIHRNLPYFLGPDELCIWFVTHNWTTIVFCVILTNVSKSDQEMKTTYRVKLKCIRKWCQQSLKKRNE